MFAKRTALLLSLAVAAVLVGGAASAVAVPGHASVVIRHELRGCHSWSLNGGAFTVRNSIRLTRGSTLAVTNTDVMPHTLVLTSGPSLRIAHPTLGHMMSGPLKVTLTRPGVYHFTTKAGEDYSKGIKTIGEDNVLKLTVIVS